MEAAIMEHKTCKTRLNTLYYKRDYTFFTVKDIFYCVKCKKMVNIEQKEG